jgi:acyl-coenzyme A thioesterase PaaI-like protein
MAGGVVMTLLDLAIIARTMAFCDGQVRDTDERLIAKALGTFKYLKLRSTD